MQTQFSTEQVFEKPLRYGEHKPFRNVAIELRGRQLHIRYIKDYANGSPIQFLAVPCPLQSGDSIDTGISRIRKVLLDNKLGLSQVVSFATNHGEHKEVIDTMNRRAYAAQH